MPDLDACTLLREADTAWFALNTGGAVRRVRDQNGEEIEYTTASRAGLLAMIRNLQILCPTYTSLALGQFDSRPMKFLF